MIELTGKSRIGLRIALAVLLVVLLVGIGAPLVNANRLRGRIQAALERSLDRPVQMGDVRLSLFTGPGFSVKDVVIKEDPAFGVEPMAYVGSVEARIGLASLWTGGLQFSSLRLIDPSVNLTRNGQGVWNVKALLDHTASATRAGREALPEISLRGGRLNFKEGTSKSSFYLDNAQLDLSLPHGEEEPVWFRFQGQPTLTSSLAQGLGRVSGQGRISRLRDAEPVLELDLIVERSSLPVVAELISGQPYPLQGLVGTRVHAGGPLNQLGVSGQISMEDVGRYPLFGLDRNASRARFGGVIDLRAQTVSLQTDAGTPMAVKLEVRSLFGQPVASLGMELHEVPLASALPLARQVGVYLPDGVQMDGRLSGYIAQPGGAPRAGELELTGVSWKQNTGSSGSAKSLHLSVRGDQLVVAPSELEFGNGQTATTEAAYSLGSRGGSLRISTSGLAQREFLVQVRPFVRDPIPLLGPSTRGSWRGSLSLVSSDEGDRWSGDVEMSGVDLTIDGLANPLRVRSAHAVLTGDQLTVDRLRARTGSVEVEGSYRYQPTGRRSHSMQLVLTAPSAAALEAELMPTLDRSGSLLARTLRLGRGAVPGWLADRHCEGDVTLRWTAPDAPGEGMLQGQLAWDGPAVRLDNVRGRIQGAAVRGSVRIDLRQASPRYTINGRMIGLAWGSGLVDADGMAEGSGVGLALLESLRGHGTFSGRGLTAGLETPIRLVNGTFTYEPVALVRDVRLEGVKLSIGPDTYYGRGDLAAGNKVQLDLWSGPRSAKLSGSLSPAQLEWSAP